MRLLRVLNHAGATVREFDNVIRTAINAGGALIIDLDPTPGRPCNWVIAAGAWAEIEEWAPEPDRIPPALVVLAGGSDAQRVHEAMQIRCICADLRCPVILETDSRVEEAQRRWFQLGRRPVDARAEDRRQCSMHIGHAIDEMDHTWIEGGWPFGPADHHPECPRFPAVYNRPLEDQPHDAARVTTPDELPTEATEPADRPLIRPYCADNTPTVVGILPVRHVNEEARAEFGICATYPPTSYGTTFCCQRTLGHDPAQGHHALHRGDHINW